jgi:hypothetical protein
MRCLDFELPKRRVGGGFCFCHNLKIVGQPQTLSGLLNPVWRNLSSGSL